MRRIALSALVIGLSCSLAHAQTSRSWELRPDGSWEQTDAPAPTVRPDPAIDRAERFVLARNHGAALSVLYRWFKDPNTRNSPHRDRALFLAAEALYQKGDRIKSFYYLDQLLDEYPDSRYFAASLEKQYTIGDDFLDGYKLRFLGLPFISATDYGIEIMYRVQQRSPGSPLAERALLRTADHYFNDSQFELAGDAYAAYIKAYPRSPLIPRVRLQRAYSSLALFRGIRYDATPLLDARSQLLDIQSDYPRLAAEHNIASLIDRIDETFARKIEWTADFYSRTGAPSAAVYNYRFLVATYPESEQARHAAARLDRFAQKYLDEPAPRGGSGYSPTTLPDQQELTQ
jgi:outer membrane protein assembly factor BamD (BamD/ComL family)